MPEVIGGTECVLANSLTGAPLNVRFWVNSGHQRATIRCPLLTQSGHSTIAITRPWVDAQPSSA